MDQAAPLARFWSEFRENRVAVLALGVAVLIGVLAILAPLIAPQDPYDIGKLTLADARRPPGSVGSKGYIHVLGTDAQGRDLLSAILYGLRISIQMGLVAALVTAQYAYFARTAHGAASAERAKDYVEAALSTPLPARTVVFRHILPNCLPPLIVVATVQVANAIALEATLSFLGLGLPVTEPSLGTLISNGFQYMLSGRYWISIYPGIALITLIVAINLVGDQVRDQLNPRLRG